MAVAEPNLDHRTLPPTDQKVPSEMETRRLLEALQVGTWHSVIVEMEDWCTTWFQERYGVRGRFHPFIQQLFQKISGTCIPANVRGGKTFPQSF